MQKQKTDEVRGTTYGTGVVFDTDSILIPELIKQIEQNKKLENKVLCLFEGCFIRGYKITRANNCKYCGVGDMVALEEAI